MSKESTDIVGKIMAFEQGELDNEEVYSLFQFLLDSGMIHSLQGSYQRMAQQLIDADFTTFGNSANKTQITTFVRIQGRQSGQKQDLKVLLNK